MTYFQGHVAPGGDAENADLGSRATMVAQAENSGSQVIDFITPLAPKKRGPTPSRWRWLTVNDVTHKLCLEGGEESITPASHGKWGGSKTPKALAWVIGVGPGVWMARCGDRSSELNGLAEAKADAIAMAKSKNLGHVVKDPVRHLLAALQEANPNE